MTAGMIREEIDGRCAGALDHRDIELALLGVFWIRRLIQRGEAGAFEKALDRRLWRADARAFFSSRVSGWRRAAGDVQREPRGVAKLARLIEEPARDQRVSESRRKSAPPASACGRDFLGEKFKQRWAWARVFKCEGRRVSSQTLCEPSHSGSFFVALQPQKNALPVASAL